MMEIEMRISILESLYQNIKLISQVSINVFKVLLEYI